MRAFKLLSPALMSSEFLQLLVLQLLEKDCFISRLPRFVTDPCVTIRACSSPLKIVYQVILNYQAGSSEID